MRKPFILSITIYQKLISSSIKSLFGLQAMCRYSPSCSEYAKQQIAKHGIIIGGWRSVKRLLTCQPFFNSL